MKQQRGTLALGNRGRNQEEYQLNRKEDVGMGRIQRVSRDKAISTGSWWISRVVSSHAKSFSAVTKSRWPLWVKFRQSFGERITACRLATNFYRFWGYVCHHRNRHNCFLQNCKYICILSCRRSIDFSYFAFEPEISSAMPNTGPKSLFHYCLCPSFP